MLKCVYGLIITLGFIGVITLGFVYELGKSALKIDSRQSNVYFYKSKNLLIHLVLVGKMNKNLNIKMEISKINLCSLTGRSRNIKIV